MNDVCTDAEMVQLVEGAQRKDRAAIDRLYDLYADKVFRYIWYRVGDRDIAEDLTMDVFLRFLQHIPRFRLNRRRPVASFSAWLFRIAGNRVIDHYRRQQRRPETELEETMPLEPNAPTPVEQALASVEREEKAELLREAIADLTDLQQQVILYKFVEGLSNNEVARMIGKSEGAVKSLQHRALATLQRTLQRMQSKKA